MTSRPFEWQLTAALPVLHRPDGGLQLGLEAPAGLVLASPPAAASRVLEALCRPCTSERLEQIAGSSSGRWLPGLLAALVDAGLLAEPAPALRPITVVGSGRLTELVTRLLLDAVPAPIRVLGLGAPGVPTRAIERLRCRHPDRLSFAAASDTHDQTGLVLCCAASMEADRVLLSELGGRPQLVVSGSDLGVGVGPFIVPGRTPCLHCEDLHRTQRDPAWPELLAQLCRQRPAPVRAAELHWAASTAVLHARSWLAGRLPDSVAATLILDADGSLRVRRLRAHPGCGCGAAR